MKKLLLGVAILFGVPSCSTDGTIDVNLANTQSEATAIYAALSPFVLALGSPSEKTAYAALGTAVSDYAAIPTGTQPTSTVISDLTGDFASVMGQLKLPADTSLAIEAGLGLINALAAGVSTVPAPATAPPATGSAPSAGQVIPAPISIPLS